MTTPLRDEIWRVRFEPSEGDEIKKIRTAVVMSEDAIGRLRLKIVVPITEWKPQYANYPWFVYLAPTRANGLTKDSGADSFQFKSVSETRFLDRLGELTLANSMISPTPSRFALVFLDPRGIPEKGVMGYSDRLSRWKRLSTAGRKLLISHLTEGFERKLPVRLVMFQPVTPPPSMPAMTLAD